jgi:hypothetical protein
VIFLLSCIFLCDMSSCDMVMLIVLIITDSLSLCSHMCRHPTKFCKNIWISSHVHILV